MDSIELKAGVILHHPVNVTVLDIYIMAVVDGFVMARRGNKHPFVYKTKDFQEVFIKSSGYRKKPNPFQ